MARRPHVSWPVALHVARLPLDPGPEVTRPEAVQTVAMCHQAARRAGELVTEFSHLPGAAASDVRVLDRTGWSKQVAQLGQAVLAGLPLPSRPDGVLRRLIGVGYGLTAGAAIAVLRRGLLGQYDPYAQRLVLLAPNLLELQRRRGFVTQDFYLWVAAHEQTHAVQFNSAPWLLGHISDLMARVAADDPNPVDTLRGLSEGRGAVSLLISQEGSQWLDRLVAAMTLLEGHADFVSDAVGARHIPTSRNLRRAFAREPGTGPLSRLLPSLDKAAQYRNGLAFCRGVAAQAGDEALAAAFATSANLPTLAEIQAPEQWVERVHGSA